MWWKKSAVAQKHERRSCGKTPFLKINAVVRNCQPTWSGISAVWSGIFAVWSGIFPLKNGLGSNISEETLVCSKRSFLCKTYLLGKRQKLSRLWNRQVYGTMVVDQWIVQRKGIYFQTDPHLGWTQRTKNKSVGWFSSPPDVYLKWPWVSHPQICWFSRDFAMCKSKKIRSHLGTGQNEKAQKSWIEINKMTKLMVLLRYPSQYPSPKPSKHVLQAG